MEGGLPDVGVRAAEHALDAALAEHRRALRLAADARERERMARSRTVKVAAAACDSALEQPVERPMRGVRLAETWIEVDRARHALTPAVRAQLGEAELRVSGDDWATRLVLAPGEGPARAAREAAARIEAAARLAVDAARRRLGRAAARGREHAAACHAAATALEAADREVAERHEDRARIDACLDELAARLGPRRAGEGPEAVAARARLEQARLYLEAPAEQPYAWISRWPKHVAALMLRDLPMAHSAVVEPAMRRLLAELRGAEELLALAAAGDGVVAATSARVLVAGPDSATDASVGVTGELQGVTLALTEQRPGRLADFAVLVRAAGAPPASAPEPAPDDAVELLRRLGELRDAGVLSAEEFAAKKAELLRRI
jgi:hypothetical protein